MVHKIDGNHAILLGAIPQRGGGLCRRDFSPGSLEMRAFPAGCDALESSRSADTYSLVLHRQIILFEPIGSGILSYCVTTVVVASSVLSTP